MKYVKINSFKAFHKLVPEIIEQVNRNNALAIRALANPLLAFEELGYELSADVQKKVELVLRFDPKSRKKLNSLEKDVYEATGGEFNIDDEEEVNTLLFKKLKLSRSKKSLHLNDDNLIRLGKPHKWVDPLQNLSDKHPVMKPLLAYRALKAGPPGFVSRRLYNQLKSGSLKLPVSNVTVSFATRHEDYDDA